MKTWMRKRGDRVRIISGKYAGLLGTVESNVYQRTVDNPDEYCNGHQVMLDTEELVTARREQVEGGSTRRPWELVPGETVADSTLQHNRVERFR